MSQHIGYYDSVPDTREKREALRGISKYFCCIIHYYTRLGRASKMDLNHLLDCCPTGELGCYYKNVDQYRDFLAFHVKRSQEKKQNGKVKSIPEVVPKLQELAAKTLLDHYDVRSLDEKILGVVMQCRDLGKQRNQTDIRRVGCNLTLVIPQAEFWIELQKKWIKHKMHSCRSIEPLLMHKYKVGVLFYRYKSWSAFFANGSLPSYINTAFTGSLIFHCGLVFCEEGKLYSIHKNRPLHCIDLPYAKKNDESWTTEFMGISNVTQQMKDIMLIYCESRLETPFNPYFHAGYKESGIFCSEMIMEALQYAGLYTGVNPRQTPSGLYYLLRGSSNKKIN